LHLPLRNGFHRWCGSYSTMTSFPAAAMLDRLLKGKLEQPEQVLIPPRLVIQNSTGWAKHIPPSQQNTLFE
jgi:hypothetical protein